MVNQRGKPLYVCREAEKRWILLRRMTMITLIFFIASNTMVIIAESSRTGLKPYFLISCIPVAVLVIVYYEVTRKMPLRIYEGGFTAPNRPYIYSVLGREIFIPWNRVHRVEVGPSKERHIFPVRSIFIHHHDGVVEITHWGQNGIEYEPLEVMKALQKCIPNKLDRSVLYYLKGGHKEVPPHMAHLYSNAERKIKVENLMHSFMLVLCFFVAVIGGVAGGNLAYLTHIMGYGWLRAVFFVLFAVISMGPVVIALIMAERRQLHHIRYGAKAGESGVVFPTALLARLIFRTRDVLPYREIKFAKMKLHPAYFFGEAEIETVSGERYTVPYEVYEKISSLPYFEMVDAAARVNRSPASSGGQVLRWSVPRAAVFMHLFLFLYTGIFLLVYFEPAWLDTSAIFLTSFVILVVGSIGLLTKGVNDVAEEIRLQRARYMAEMEVTPTHISLPYAPRKFRRINRVDYEGARLGKGIAGEYCEIRCRAGKIRLPREAADILKSAGYPVEG